MITLTLPLAPSRHKRSAKAEIAEALRSCPQVRMIQQRRYRVDITYYGQWNNKDGTPKKRDPDSVIIPLLDAIAQVAGMRGDQWINREGSWRTVESDRETVTVVLTPI